MEKTKLPPQSIEAEENVLGAMLVNPLVVPRIAELLSAEMFYDPAHVEIYASIMELFNTSRPVDIITVSEDLNTKDKLKKIGGRAKINTLATNVVTTANAEYYAKIVAEKSSLRDLINAGSDIVEMAYEEGSTGEVLELAERAIFSIAQKRTKSDLVHIKDIVGESYEQIDARYHNSDELSGVSTGFYDLDAMTSGLQKSDLIILAARPSVGKTTFAMNIAQNVGVQSKKPVLVFSLEMKKDQIVRRMLCSQAEIDMSRLNSGRMQNKDWVDLSEAMGVLAEAPIYIDDTPILTITDLRAKCRKAAMKLGEIGLVVIDYLQLMEGTQKGGNADNRVNVISAISRGLKGIAREAGSRTKIAVYTEDENVDPVGSCVGPRGVRVQAVVDEMFGEKIDVINWSDEPEELISNVLAPAKVEKVIIGEDEKSATVIVPDYQLSLAIGKEGQNVRLAAKLSGWKIDIKSHSQYFGADDIEYVDEYEEDEE